MKDYAVMINYEDGSSSVDGYYKFPNTAICIAEKNNACKYLPYHYSVIQVSTNKVIYD